MNRQMDRANVEARATAAKMEIDAIFRTGYSSREANDAVCDSLDDVAELLDMLYGPREPQQECGITDGRYTETVVTQECGITDGVYTEPRPQIADNRHGHVFPNADGSKSRCGGPGKCPSCTELAERVGLPGCGGE